MKQIQKNIREDRSQKQKMDKKLKEEKKKRKREVEEITYTIYTLAAIDAVVWGLWEIVVCDFDYSLMMKKLVKARGIFIVVGSAFAA